MEKEIEGESHPTNTRRDLLFAEGKEKEEQNNKGIILEIMKRPRIPYDDVQMRLI
jgi:hypothetical protein